MEMATCSVHLGPMGGHGARTKFPQRTYANFEANRNMHDWRQVGIDYELMPARTYTSHGWSE